MATNQYPTHQTRQEAEAQRRFAEKILKQYQREGVQEGDPACDEVNYPTPNGGGLKANHQALS